ncbi:Spore germination protein B3 precursor [Clostridium sp. N3C]|uniref:Ger(x)C family spore germination protein n=1 Tax=Clostridium sp. N3C TaxID=1776758 RepID=UPI00092E16BD|nr:Ger(x)C family spore germination protein [Clostridium sp. N3C]SCN23351.1 Spore germination protein B3 precursor [Clostridium sp. N3C]
MKSIFRNIIIFLTIIGIMFTTTGCKDKVDIQDLAIVMAMGIDYTDESQYKVSYQIFTASTFQGGSGGPKGGSGGIVAPYFEGFGETLTEAMHEMEDRIGKKIHFGQLKVVIIGEKAGEEGISLAIDTMARLVDIKTNVPIYVTKGEASKIIMQRPSEDAITANVIDNIVLKEVRTGANPVVYLAQIADKLSSKHCFAPVLGVITIPKRNEISDSSAFEMEGMAVFSEDKLKGYLDRDITLGYQFIMGEIKLLTTSIRLSDGNKATLQIQRCKSKVKTTITEDMPQVDIYIKIYSVLMDITGDMDFLKNPELLTQMENVQRDIIKKKVNETIAAAKEDMKLDFIGFGNIIYKQHPKEFEKIKDNWQELFINLPIKVTVDIEVKDTGLLSKPIY